MADELNVIVSGKYAGQKIVLAASNMAYLKESRVSIFSETVESIRIIDAKDGSALTGYLVAGIVGALVAKDLGGYSLVEITWKGGEKSIAKMTKGGDDMLIAAAYGNVGSSTPEQAFKNEWEQENKNVKAWTSLGKWEKCKIYSLKVLAILLILGAIAGGVLFGLEGIIWAAALCVIVLGLFACLLYLVYYRKRNATSVEKMRVGGAARAKLEDGKIVFRPGATSIKSISKKYVGKADSLVIPRSVKMINPVFQGYGGKIKSVYYEGDLREWCAIAGLGNLPKVNCALYVQGEKVTGDLVLPDGIRTIESCAFSYMEDLTSVIIPQGASRIDDLVFSHCTGLTSVTIPVTVRDIGYGAFDRCINLTSIIYQGTTAQWNAITKRQKWDKEMGYYAVICTDGRLEKY